MQPAPTEEEKRQKEPEARRKWHDLTVTSIYNAVKANDKRMDIIRDPVAKNLIPIYMISSIVDVLSVAVSMSMDSDIVSEESAAKIAAINEILSSRLNSLIEWVQSPIYAPNHPVGQEMMQGAAKNFVENAKLTELREALRSLGVENELLRAQVKELRG